MGTRNLTVVVVNKKVKVAQYGQWDGYPTGLGTDLLKLLKNRDNREAIKSVVSKCKFIESRFDLLAGIQRENVVFFTSDQHHPCYIDDNDEIKEIISSYKMLQDQNQLPDGA